MEGAPPTENKFFFFSLGLHAPGGSVCGTHTPFYIARCPPIFLFLFLHLAFNLCCCVNVFLSVAGIERNERWDIPGISLLTKRSVYHRLAEKGKEKSREIWMHFWIGWISWRQTFVPIAWVPSLKNLKQFQFFSEKENISSFSPHWQNDMQGTQTPGVRLIRTRARATDSSKKGPKMPTTNKRDFSVVRFPRVWGNWIDPSFFSFKKRILSFCRARILPSFQQQKSN